MIVYKKKIEKLQEVESFKTKTTNYIVYGSFLTTFVLMKVSQGIRYDDPLKMTTTYFQIITTFAKLN